MRGIVAIAVIFIRQNTNRTRQVKSWRANVYRIYITFRAIHKHGKGDFICTWPGQPVGQKQFSGWLKSNKESIV